MTTSLAHPPTPTPEPTPTAPGQPLRVLATHGLRRVPNPYTRLLHEGVAQGGAVVGEYGWRAALTQRVDVIHLHWPEYLLRSRKAPLLSGARRKANLAVLWAAKRRGAKLFWTVHNLKPHGLKPTTAWRPYTQFLELVDGLFYLSSDSRRMFIDRYPAAKGIPGFVAPHGVFNGVYPSGVTREAARRKLGLPPSAVVAASVGGVERYKNLVSLIRAQKRLGRDDLWVVIAGRPASVVLERELRAEAAGSGKTRLHLRFIAEDELQDFFAAADFCAAPYTDILNSGAVLLALSFGCPVLCPSIGSLEELRGMVGAEWLRTYRGEFTAQTLADAAEWSRSPRPAAPPSPAEMQWPHLGRQTVAAYHAVLDARVAPTGFWRQPAAHSVSADRQHKD